MTGLPFIHTNKLDGFREESCQILTPMVHDRYLHVFDPIVLKAVWDVGRNIQNIAYPQFGEEFKVFTILLGSEVQVGQDLGGVSVVQWRFCLHQRCLDLEPVEAQIC